ncbi:MAG: glycosyltransferase family 39 protein [Verrucomicrobiaceae bacterium]|nr:glycosyltransferase family 39 protein [Verrucomicrobiaceae bacterium]
MDRQRFLISALTFIMVCRMALLPTTELSPDEALAVMNAARPDLWHAEMGPLVPWLVKISTSLLGMNEFAVRVWAPLLAFVASGLLWRLGRGIANPNVASWAVVGLQVVPGFNVAATTMTTSIVSLTAALGVVVSIRVALLHASPRHYSWFIGALCTALAILTDWRNGITYLCALTALGIPLRRRHHLFKIGFLSITGAAAVSFGAFVFWNQMHDWPLGEIGSAAPEWIAVSNLLRWMVLLSPLMFCGVTWALRQSLERWRVGAGHGQLLVFALPYTLLDFFWGPLERWPSMGWLIWVALALVMLADHTTGVSPSELSRKVLLRTGTFALAMLLSLVLLRSDFVRSLGLPWKFSQDFTEKNTWRGFLFRDPSGGMMGWRQQANTLAAVLQKNSGPQAPWFVIAENWQMAAATEFYLPEGLHLIRPTVRHPRIHAPQTIALTSPHSLWPRYDSVTDGHDPFAGASALFVTSADAKSPPAEIQKRFDHTEVLSVARVMHAGMELRTLKIFACHRYQPPEF